MNKLIRIGIDTYTWQGEGLTDPHNLDGTMSGIV
jgi:hypothetical protein